MSELKLPLRLHESETGSVVDADGQELFVIDVHNDRPDSEVIHIARALVAALNAGINALERERDLLEANNRYLERARAAERRVRQLEGNIHERLARLEAMAHPPVEIEPIVREIIGAAEVAL